MPASAELLPLGRPIAVDENSDGTPGGRTSPYLPTGTVIGSYQIESYIDRGGMAFVYLALDLRLNRRVAFKVLAPEVAMGSDFRERFLRESRFAASIDHPNIVPIYEAGEADGLLYIAMRYVEGVNLDTLLRSSGRLEPPRAIAILAPVADALDTAHDAGLVHRDVKPANILLATPTGRGRDAHEHVYLSDFGVTKRTSAFTKLTATGHLIGTMAYTAPEQIRGEPLDARSDLYAFGCVAYECLTGVPPFVRDDQAALLWAHLSEPPAPISDFRPDLRGADAVVTRALAKEPRDRYQTCEQFISALSAALVSHHHAAAPAVPADSTARSDPTPGPLPAGRNVNVPDDPTARTVLIRPNVSHPPDPLATAAAGPPSRPGGPPPQFAAPAPRSRRRRTGLAAAAVAVLAIVIIVVGVSVFAGRSHTTASGTTQPGAAAASSTTTPTSTDAAATAPVLGRVTTSAGKPMQSNPQMPMPGASSRVKTSASHTSAAATNMAGMDMGGMDMGGTATTHSAPSTVSNHPLPGLAFPTITGKISIGGHPGFIALSPDGTNAYVADGSANRVAVIGTEDDQSHGYIPISEGTPRFIAFSPDGKTIYVSVSNADKTVNAVAILDAATASEMSSIKVDKGPFALAVSPDGRYLLVPSHDTGILDVIDLSKRAVIKRLPVPANPHWVTFSRDGKRAYIANHESNVVTVLDVASQRIIKTIPVGNSPHSVAVSPNGSQVAVVCYVSNNVYLINAATLGVTTSIAVGAGPRDVVYSPDGRLLYIANEGGNSLSVVDTKTRRSLGVVPTDSPEAVAVVPDGHKAYVTNLNNGTVTIIKTA